MEFLLFTVAYGLAQIAWITIFSRSDDDEVASPAGRSLNKQPSGTGRRPKGPSSTRSTPRAEGGDRRDEDAETNQSALLKRVYEAYQVLDRVQDTQLKSAATSILHVARDAIRAGEDQDEHGAKVLPFVPRSPHRKLG